MDTIGTEHHPALDFEVPTTAEQDLRFVLSSSVVKVFSVLYDSSSRIVAFGRITGFLESDGVSSEEIDYHTATGGTYYVRAETLYSYESPDPFGSPLFGPFMFSATGCNADVPPPPPPPSGGICRQNQTTLCLDAGRFRVSVDWAAVHQGTSGQGQAIPITTDTGYFWFFSSSNIELVIKVLDGRPINGRFWVFYGALTNVQYTITVYDTQTGATKRYTCPQDTQASYSDTDAF